MTATTVFAQGDRGEKGDRGEQVSWDRDTMPSIPSGAVPLLRGCRALCAHFHTFLALPGLLCCPVPFDTHPISLPFLGKGWPAWTPRAPRAQGR